MGIWIAGSAVMPVIGFISVAGCGWAPRHVALSGIDSIAFTFIFGIPVFLGAGIVFTSPNVRQYIVDKFSREYSPRKIFTIRFIVFFIICALYMVIITVGGFFNFMRFAESITGEYLFFIPGTIIAGLILLTFLCPIATTITLALDDWRWTTILGGALFYSLSLATGFPHNLASYPEVAFLGPAQLFRVYAALMSGIDFPTPSSMVEYFGMYFNTTSLVIPTLVFISVSILSLFCAPRLYKRNCKRWVFELSSWTKEEPQIPRVESPESAKILEKMKNELNRRRTILTTFITILIVIAPIVSTSYTTSRTEEPYEVIIYVSPVGGESLAIGDTKYSEFEVWPPPPGFSRMIGFELEILDWGECPDKMWFQDRCLHMTIDEFESMNETEVWPGQWGSLIEKPTTSYDKGYYGLTGEWGTHVWAIRFVDENWEIVSGTLRILLVVRLKDIEDPFY